MEPSNKSEKLVEIDTHCICAMSGIVGDARILIDHARVEAQNHKFNFNESMDIEAITQSVSDIAINFGEGYEGSKRKPMSRPYGVALLIAGVDNNGPQLYQTDPSGTFWEWQANAIGSGQETAQNTLKEQYYATMSLVEAEKMVLQVLKANMEEKICKDNVEIMVIKTATRRWERRSTEELDRAIQNLS